ncbi:MAG: aspartate--tRNA ligase [Owenweeksia sp.]|nr:aspartate--tRNA ligase [Owenweeksia sp.]MBF97996.1 aspartate--tRNA ligase [Owenweeksia sp.]HBF21718.1 aspartate--tRNA ligase [Cryomorphaceae bacterium]HCQ15562.1 aspartate--tRNA ligase [Cryomorphaceae bacterium]
MHRTHTCGELNLQHEGKNVKLAGWVQRVRNLGGMTFIDLRDRYGITQLAFNEEWDTELLEKARKTGREFVIQAEGTVIERSSKNPNMSTGEIEIRCSSLTVLNASKTPPFTIEDETDGGEELRMKYRYLDLRRNPLKENIMLRHRVNIETRNYLSSIGFLDIETPFLIKSTPEGARDFVVPSRMHEGQFYALPQSPQTFKQLLMVSGFDKYFQIVKCFRDEDLRADRQPEFTQIDCEMAFVEREDILNTFEGFLKHILKTVKGVDIDSIPRMTYDEAMALYGSDKPDIRFGMTFTGLNELTQNKGFNVFDQAELVVGINVEGCAEYSRKQIDALTDFVKRPQVGGSGLVWCKYNADGTLKSSVDKFYSPEDLKEWAEAMDAKPGDLLLIMAGPKDKTRKALNELRLHLAEELGLRKPDEFAPLWVLDFPLLEWDEDTARWYAMHHPFTSPYPKDIPLLDTDPGSIRANAYDLVLNGNEIGGGSIRIHDRDLQKKMFGILGFSDEEAKKQFGFLMDAFEYGAPPHGGIAFGFDRLVAILGGKESIRDFMAFPKNNAGRDLMIDTPSIIGEEQLKELRITITE